jgi:hypothetical protein
MSIDFFILDDISDNLLIQEFTIIKAKFIYGMLRSKRYKDDTSKMSPTEKLVAGICKSIGKLFTLKQLLKAYIRNTAKYNGNGHENVIRSNSILYAIQKSIILKQSIWTFTARDFRCRWVIMKCSLSNTVII